jgi:hypothetical protein
VVRCVLGTVLGTALAPLQVLRQAIEALGCPNQRVPELVHARTSVGEPVIALGTGGAAVFELTSQTDDEEVVYPLPDGSDVVVPASSRYVVVRQCPAATFDERPGKRPPRQRPALVARLDPDLTWSEPATGGGAMRRILLGAPLTVLSLGAAMMSPGGSGDDPNIAPYPGRYEVARTKGVAPNEDPVPLDITGTWDLQQQVDKIADLVKREPALDGGLSMDADARAVVVRLVRPVDGTSPEVERLKSSVMDAAEGLTVEFRSVQYSRAELEQLADSLFRSPDLTGIGGGWDCSANRVVVLIELGTDDTQTLLDRIRALDDDRIMLHTFTPIPGVGGPE